MVEDFRNGDFFWGGNKNTVASLFSRDRRSSASYVELYPYLHPPHYFLVDFMNFGWIFTVSIFNMDFAPENAISICFVISKTIFHYFSISGTVFPLFFDFENFTGKYGFWR